MYIYKAKLYEVVVLHITVEICGLKCNAISLLGICTVGQ